MVTGRNWSACLLSLLNPLHFSELTTPCCFVCFHFQAGGASSGDGLCKSSLDINIEAYDQRTEVCFGSTGEVRRFEEYLYGNSPRFSTANELEVRWVVGSLGLCVFVRCVAPTGFDADLTTLQHSQ